MKKLRTLILASLALMFSMVHPTITAHAVVCFYDSDYISGMNKICYYDCMGSRAAITVRAVDICPLSINR
jgi:hypothetical protein|tara:strand:- start:885 stop:1094 length:210 start_codon:yes stop_codon:yes gene_type:complete